MFYIKKNLNNISAFIPINEPILNGNEKKYLNECIFTGWISSEELFVKLFEKEFAARVGRKTGFTVCKGNAASDSALEEIGYR
jgi:perosamine synthetase